MMQCLCSLSLGSGQAASTPASSPSRTDVKSGAPLQFFVILLSIAHHCFSKLIVFWVWYLSTSGMFLCSSYTGVFMPEKYIIYSTFSTRWHTHTHNRLPGSQNMCVFNVKGQNQSYNCSYNYLFSHCNI